MATPRRYVEAPPVTPLPYGLLSAATVLDDLDGLNALGVEYEPEACGDNVYDEPGACTAAPAPPEPDQTSRTVYDDGVPLITGDVFGLYHLFKCAPVGMTEEQFLTRARNSLRLGEQRALERVVAGDLAADPDVLYLNGGDALHPVLALAALQEHAASNYGGVPVIHSPVGVTTVLDHYGVVHRSSNNVRIETLQGAVVASGAGYDQMTAPGAEPDDVAPSGQAYLYVTGQVVIHRGTVQTLGPVMDRAPARNVRAAMVERMYAATWECVTAAVAVDLGVLA